MSNPAANTSIAKRLQQYLPTRKTLLAFVGGAAVAAAATVFAGGDNMVAGMHDTMMAMHQGHGDMNRHVDAILAHLYKAVGATDAQKAKLEPIMRQAASDLAPMHDQLFAAHQQLLTMLSQDVIDRSSLESFRAAQMQNVDNISKRLFQMAEDLGDVLTPAQRQQLAEHIKHMHAQHHG